MSEDETTPVKAHRFLSMFVDWKKVATTLLLGGMTIIYTGAGWVWSQFGEHQKQIQTLQNDLHTYKAYVLPEQQELVRRNLQLEQRLNELLLETRMLRYQAEWHHQPTKGQVEPAVSAKPVQVDPDKPALVPVQAVQAVPADFAEWWKKAQEIIGAKTITPDDIKRFREQAQQVPNLPYSPKAR